MFPGLPDQPPYTRPPPCRRSVTPAARSPRSATRAPIPWSRRSAASTRTSSGSASTWTGRPSVRTCARGASTRARSRNAPSGLPGTRSRAPEGRDTVSRVVSDPSLLRFRAVVEGALDALEARRQEVNDLNVFPVADGDTGDNMALTLRAVLAELDR